MTSLALSMAGIMTEQEKEYVSLTLTGDADSDDGPMQGMLLAVLLSAALWWVILSVLVAFINLFRSE